LEIRGRENVGTLFAYFAYFAVDEGSFVSPIQGTLIYEMASTRCARFSQAIIFWAFSPLKFGLREQFFVTFVTFVWKSDPWLNTRPKSKVGFAHPWLREFPGYAMLAGARADDVGKVILKNMPC
jgi:hypothetical protein